MTVEMREIKVYWTDAEMVDHEFYMEVPVNETKPNVDHLVKDTVFDEAVSDYFWESK